MDSNKLLESVWSQPRSLIGGQMAVESSYYTYAISSSQAMGLLQLKILLQQMFMFTTYLIHDDNLKGAFRVSWIS